MLPISKLVLLFIFLSVAVKRIICISSFLIQRKAPLMDNDRNQDKIEVSH